VVDRSGWNQSKISAEFTRAFPFQKAFCDLLRSALPQFRLVYPETESQEKRTKFDCQVIPTVGAPIKLELECGLYQSHWIDRLPPPHRWPRGLSVPSRKVLEGRNYDVYIKFSKSLKSYFATTPEYLINNGAFSDSVRHSLGYKTDSDFFAVRWDRVVLGDEFSFDDFEHLKTMITRICDKNTNPTQKTVLPT
jgi:hypothetical protein